MMLDLYPNGHGNSHCYSTMPISPTHSYGLRLGVQSNGSKHLKYSIKLDNEMSMVGAVVLWVGKISSLFSVAVSVGGRVYDSSGGCGVGVCGGVPSGVPHACSRHSWARDKYIAPLNLQKASSREVNRW